MTVPDLAKPDDPYSLITSWIAESESAYRAAEAAASDAATSATSQAQSAADAESAMADEHGKTAQAVSGGYATNAAELREHAVNFTTISGWMLDAASKVEAAKRRTRQLVNMGTEEIRDALESELAGTPTSPSSTELTATYRADISQVKAKLDIDLAAIGHSLAGDPGASRTPSYVSVSLTPTPEHSNPAAQVVAYNTGPAPEVTPQVLPEMPRASSAETPRAPSSPSTPAAPAAAPHPTLAGLMSPQGASGSAASLSSNGSGTPSTSSGGGASTSGSQPQGHQAPEQHQQAKSPVLPGIPNIPLLDLPATAASIATAVTSAATGTQLPTAPAQQAPQAPASAGVTPGTPGAAVPPMTPGLGPIGGLNTPPVVQGGAPAPQVTPAAPATGAQTPAQQVSTPAPRGPVVDTAWLQKTYGLAPGLELPKSETAAIPALFIVSLPEDEARLHRALASIRQAFEQADWGQPMAVARISRGLETRTVYATSDAISIWPQGVLLPTGVIPLYEMPSIPSTPELSGSIMVQDKLAAAIPSGWTVEHLLSSVPGDEHGQSIEQYQALVEAEELLPCTVVRGEDGAPEEQAFQVFAKATLGQNTPGISDLNADSAQLKAARWVGTQPTGYLDVLSRWHLSDAAGAMGRGLWGEAMYAIEKFESIWDTKKQAA